MIGRRSKSHQLLIASAIVGTLAWHSAAMAQDAPAAAPAPEAAAMVGGEAVTANDIIVTATRTTQKLENVPASIIAVTGQALQTAGVTRFQDLALVAPGVQVSRSGTYTQPSIRGISTSFAGGGQETNVAVYIDGIYQSDQLGTNQDLSNIQDIQILKGPQGTLYGRNATGGAILITTRSPTDKFQAEANVSYAPRYNDKIGNIFVGGPITNGIKFSVAGSFHQSDGYFKDINHFSRNVVLDSTDYNFNGSGTSIGHVNFGKSADRKGNNTAPYKNWSVRPKLVLEPLDGLKITLGFVHTYLNDPRGLAYDEVGNNTFNPAAGYRGAGDPTFNSGTGAHGQGTSCDPLVDGSICNSVTQNRRNKTSLNFRPYNESKQNEVNATVEWKLGDAGTITAHAAERWQKDYQMYDLDGTPRDAGTGPIVGAIANPQTNPALGTTGVATAFDSIQHNKRKTFVGQLDYNGQFGNLNLLSGFFYYQDRFQSTGYADTGGGTSPTVSFLDFKTKAWGVYIDGTYNINDKLFITAGVRYNHDGKQLEAIQINNDGVTINRDTASHLNSSACWTTGSAPVYSEGAPGVCTADAVKKASKNAWTPHVVLRYNLSRGTNIYASWSRGFKAGTINGASPYNVLKPETVTAYEVGIKTARGGFRGEASAFYYNYKNNQISAYNGTTTVVSNSGGAHVYGLDLSLQYKVPDMPLNLRGGMEYLHARYTDFDNASNVTSANLDGTGANTNVIGSWTGRRLLRAPDWTASVGADYTLENVFGGKLVTSLTAQYSSRYAPQNASYICAFHTAAVTANGEVAGQKYCNAGTDNHKKGRFEENGWAQLNAQINWTDASDHYTIGVFGNNINNVHYKIVASQTAYGSYNMYNEPQTFGVRAGVKF